MKSHFHNINSEIINKLENYFFLDFYNFLSDKSLSCDLYSNPLVMATLMSIFNGLKSRLRRNTLHIMENAIKTKLRETNND